MWIWWRIMAPVKPTAKILQRTQAHFFCFKDCQYSHRETLPNCLHTTAKICCNRWWILLLFWQSLCWGAQQLKTGPCQRTATATPFSMTALSIQSRGSPSPSTQGWRWDAALKSLSHSAPFFLMVAAGRFPASRSSLKLSQDPFFPALLQLFYKENVIPVPLMIKRTHLSFS